MSFSLREVKSLSNGKTNTSSKNCAKTVEVLPLHCYEQEKKTTTSSMLQLMSRTQFERLLST